MSAEAQLAVGDLVRLRIFRYRRLGRVTRLWGRYAEVEYQTHSGVAPTRRSKVLASTLEKAGRP